MANDTTLGYANLSINASANSSRIKTDEIDREMKTLDYFMRQHKINPNASGVSKIIDDLMFDLTNSMGFTNSYEKIQTSFQDIRHKLLKLKPPFPNFNYVNPYYKSKYK